MLLDLRSLQEAHDLTAAGAALSGGNADLPLFAAIGASAAGTGAGNADVAVLDAIGAQGVAASGGGGFLSLLVSLVGTASLSASGTGTLGLLEALAAAGSPAVAGAADLTAFEVFSAAGTARVAGFAELEIWTLGFMVVAVQVPRPTGSYILTSPVSGAQREYVVSAIAAGGGLVQVPPDELARFLRAVPGSQVVDPAQAELFRIARPFIAQVAGPFRGE